MRGWIGHKTDARTAPAELLLHSSRTECEAGFDAAEGPAAESEWSFRGRADASAWNNRRKASSPSASGEQRTLLDGGWPGKACVPRHLGR
jgi:hypothetical protein